MKTEENINENQQEQIDETTTMKEKRMIEDGKYTFPVDMKNLISLYVNSCKNIRLNNQFDQLKELTLSSSNYINVTEKDGGLIEFPSLEKMNVCNSNNIIIKIDSPKIKNISIIYSDNIELRGKIHSVEKLHFELSNNLRIEYVKLTNRECLFEQCKNIHFMKGDKEVKISLDKQITYIDFKKCCKHVLQLPQNDIDVENITQVYRMTSFYDTYYVFDNYDETNQLVIKKDNFEKYLSSLVKLRNTNFCEHNYDFMEIMTDEGKKTISSVMRYFEITSYGKNKYFLQVFINNYPGNDDKNNSIKMF